MLAPVFHVEILMEGGIKHFMNACFQFVIYCPQTPFPQNLLGKKRGRDERAIEVFIAAEKRGRNRTKLNTVYRKTLSL